MSLSPTDATNLVVDVAALGVANELGQKYAGGIDKRTQSRKKKHKSKPKMPKSYKRAKARHRGLVSDLFA